LGEAGIDVAFCGFGTHAIPATHPEFRAIPGGTLPALRTWQCGERIMTKWMCQQCGWIYDEFKGDPAGGLAAGTRWEDVPDDWICPDCGASKADFEMVEL
jgi:rubredoxin